MRRQLERYASRLAGDRSVAPGRFGLVARGDALQAEGDPGLVRLGEAVLSRLPCAALLVGRPSLPFAEFLVRRAPPGRARIVPRDSETRTFLRDIPFLRAERRGADPAGRVAALLSSRRAGVVEGVGIVAAGAASIEQAYVHYSSVFHATFVKYLEDLLREGFVLPGEENAMRAFRDSWPPPPPDEGLAFRRGPLRDADEIREELATVGRYTVEWGLVDSVFGNISWFADGMVHISRTGAGLDDLRGNIVSVPLGGPAPAGAGASSELPIHRRIYETGTACAILHGHPRFAVLLGLLCGEEERAPAGGAAERGRIRFVEDAPLVGDETGAAGFGGGIPRAVASHGIAVAQGHGVFAAGRNGLAEAFRSMAALERRCRREYFRRLEPA